MGTLKQIVKGILETAVRLLVIQPTDRLLVLQILFVLLEGYGTKTHSNCVSVRYWYMPIVIKNVCINCFIHTLIYITLFAAMKCPLNDRFISPTCQGLIGEKCDVTCGDDNLLRKAQIVCLSSGSWDTNARDVCIQNNQHGTMFKLL